MGEIFSKAGLHCSVYAGSRDRLKEITALEDVNVIVCGNYEQAFTLRDGTTNLKLGNNLFGVEKVFVERNVLEIILKLQMLMGRK